MKRLATVVAVILMISGCLSGSGVPSDQRCTVSFKEATASSTVEITQVVEEDGMLEIFYTANETVTTVELLTGGTVVQANSTVPPGSHVMRVSTDQLETENATLTAKDPEKQTIAEYQIITTGCTDAE